MRPLNQNDFEALRAKGLHVVGGTLSTTGRAELYPSLSPKAAKLADGIKALDTLRVDKARLTVKKKTFPKDPQQRTEIFKSYDYTPGGRRVLALDLSTSCIGMAWGTPGKKPDASCNYPFNKKEGTEATRLLAAAKICVWEAQRNNCGFVIFSEFYTRQRIAMKVNAALRGAVMAALAEVGIEALPVAEITARKAAGVDITKRKPEDGPKDGWMKRRVEKFLEAQGMNVSASNDENDAIVLLMGATAVIQIGDDNGQA